MMSIFIWRRFTCHRFNSVISGPFSSQKNNSCTPCVPMFYNKSGRDTEKIDFCNFCWLILKYHITVVSPFCNSTSKKNKNLRFHHFPKKRELKDQWIAKICWDDGDYFAITENTRVCSKHFCEEDYTVSEDGKGKKIVLKKGAVLTIFKWSREKRSRSTFASKGKH